jgi:hypothetical protein
MEGTDPRAMWNVRRFCLGIGIGIDVWGILESCATLLHRTFSRESSKAEREMPCSPAAEIVDVAR